MVTYSIKKNYIYNLANQLISFAVPLILTPYISRIFLSDGIGINSYTTATVTYFTLFSMIGISGYGQQSLSVIRDDRIATSKLFWELQLIHLITFIITGVIYTGVALQSENYKPYYLIHYITLVACFFDINWIYQAYEKFKLIAIRNSVIKILLLVCTFYFVHQKSDLKIYIIFTALSTLISNLFLWIDLHKYVNKVSFNELMLRRHFKEIIIYFIPTIAGSIYQILDKSVINWITHDEAENGYYEQAYRILALACVAVQSLATVSAPRMANIYFLGNREEFKQRLNSSLQFMLLMAFPVAFGVSAIASNFVPLFFGEGFDKVIIILYLFSPLIIILGFSFYIDTMFLVPSGKRGQSAAVISIGAVMNLILNIVLVIKLASIGAAIATLITEVVIASLMIFLGRKMIALKKLSKAILEYGIASLLMFFAVKVLSHLQLESIHLLLLQITVGVVSYSVLLIIMRDSFVFSVIEKIKKRYHF